MIIKPLSDIRSSNKPVINIRNELMITFNIKKG